MYDPHLDTFIKVADTGSFSKAAEQLFISPTAVVKKINILESNLGVRLFTRTYHGVALTAAGMALYNDAKYIINYSNIAVSRAKNAMSEQSNIIRIGKSLNTPCDILMDIWPDVQQLCPELKLSIIPFENTTDAVDDMFRNLGYDRDAYIGLIDPTSLAFRKCMGLRMRTEPLKIAVTADHRLYGKKRITFRDLYGEKLMMVQAGRFSCYDKLRQEICSSHPQINIIDCETIRIEDFNRCANDNNPIVIVDEWRNIHPLFHTIPAAWEHGALWGVVCAKNPSPQVSRFLEAVERVLNLTKDDYY